MKSLDSSTTTMSGMGDLTITGNNVVFNDVQGGVSIHTATFNSIQGNQINNTTVLVKQTDDEMDHTICDEVRSDRFFGYLALYSSDYATVNFAVS